MAKKINYASNLTCLVQRVRGMKRNLALPADGELFGEFLDREIHFVSVTVGRIHRALQASSFTQDRIQFTVDLKHVSVLLADVLEGIVQQRFPMGQYLETHASRYARILNKLRSGIVDLEQQLAEMSGRGTDGTHIVSEEEFIHLLSPGDDSSD